MAAQDDWLSHRGLKIFKGLGKTPGDTNSAENNPVVVNLMSGAISLDEWTPEVAQVKGNGIWADSPLSDGRRLIAASSGNVTEKMSILITSGTYAEVARALSGLNQIALDCRDYWQTSSQIEPVYLAWWANCGIGYQYALLSNIELSPDYQQGIQPTMRVSVTLEREPYWRGIPPGANPKIWSYEVNASHPQFNVNGASLLSGTDHLITATVQNKHEWTPAATGLQLTAISKNYIDIPAALVPGDAPALVELSIEPSAAAIKPINSFVGVTSNPFIATGHDGITRAQALILNAGDHQGTGLCVKTATTNEFGVLSNNSAVTYYNGVRTVTGVDPDWITAAMWGAPVVANILKLDRELYRGKYAVFVRAYNTSAAAPVITDMKMRMQFIEGSDTNPTNVYTLPEVNVPLLDTNLDFALTYMGVIDIPFEGKSITSALGYGRQIQDESNNIRVVLQQQVMVATANRTFTLIDLIMMPIDQGLAQIVTTPIDGVTVSSLILDNTGYMGRGSAEPLAFSFQRNFADAYLETGGTGQEVRGQSIELQPRTNQRLYFINNYFVSTAATRRGLMDSFTVRVNVCPRWASIRTE